MLLRTTFSNWPGARRSYPGSYPADEYPAGAGALETGTLGCSFGQYTSMDSVYRMRFVIQHSAPRLALTFRALRLQDLADESWGLDNLRITLASSAGRFQRIYLPIIQ